MEVSEKLRLPQFDQALLHRLEVLARAKVHSDEAFSTCEEAEADAIARAKLEIADLVGTTDFGGSEFMDGSPPGTMCSESDENLAARFEISFDGKRYAFRQYRYDRFQDALRYSKEEHSKAGFLRDVAFRPNWEVAYQPTDEEECAMRLHGIAFVAGRYLYGGYCYGRLCDAVAFAEGHPNL